MGEHTRTATNQVGDERMNETFAVPAWSTEIDDGSNGGAAANVKDGSKRAVGMAQNNPLGLALGAAAVGFVAGSLLPGTRIEEERLGPVASQARDLASEAIEHGKQVAEDATEAAMDAAKDSGQEHAEQLRSSAQDRVSS